MIAHCWIVLAAIGYAVDLLRQTRSGLTNGDGRTFGDDFINYWSASYLALHARAAEIYNWTAFHIFQESILGPFAAYYSVGPNVPNYLLGYHYSYPPVLFLMTAPLALIPYVPALGLWLIASWYAFYRALKLTLFPHALLLALAAPAVFVNAVGGQNGAWTAALLGGGLLLLDRRPIIAGIMFGLLIYKPHLGVMLPIALLAGWRWRAIIAAGVTAVCLVLSSIAVFGLEIWSAYAERVTVLRHIILEDGFGVWHRMDSVFVFARRLGFDVHGSYAMQAIAAIVAAVFVARSWWRNDRPEIRYALLVLGTCLATPYLQDYDLVIGAFVVVWLAAISERSELPRWQFQLAMAAILLLPLITAPIGKMTGFSIGPLVFAPMFAFVVARSASRVAKLPSRTAVA